MGVLNVNILRILFGKSRLIWYVFRKLRVGTWSWL